MSADFDASSGDESQSHEPEATVAARLQTALSDLLAELHGRDQQTNERFAILCERLVALEGRLLTTFSENLEASPTVEEPKLRAAFVEPANTTRSSVTSAAKDGDWETVLFGLEMASSDAMASLRSALVEDLKRGDCAALAFLGQLLLFRSAEAERISPLLKDLGESYYAWSTSRRVLPNDEPQAFVAWLVRRCGAVGVSNVIELVHVGDRVDLARHYATGRGAEVAAVHGWVVLRDNGKVYTKATVTAQ